MKTIAAFDFDGTLTKTDTLVSFICYSQGYWKTIQALIRCLPYFMQFSLGLKSRQQVKEKLIAEVYGNVPYSAALCQGARFASEKLDDYLLPERMDLLEWHKVHGHQCVLISANFDLFLEPWGKRWGFEAVLCSKTSHRDNHITGKLDGLNCWGEEKVRKLLEWAGPKEEFILYAYGDSAGDKELLKLADYPTKF